ETDFIDSGLHIDMRGLRSRSGRAVTERPVILNDPVAVGIVRGGPVELHETGGHMLGWPRVRDRRGIDADLEFFGIRIATMFGIVLDDMRDAIGTRSSESVGCDGPGKHGPVADAPFVPHDIPEAGPGSGAG